ncbi:MAG: protein kinase [Planctomycetota bacterium]
MVSSWNSLSDEDLELIDRSCDHFEVRWKAGACPVIEAIVSSVPTHVRNGLCRELALLEFELRQSRGEAPSLSEYSRRFPEISDELTQRQSEELQSSSAPGNPRATPDSLSTVLACIDGTSIPRQIGQYQILETTGVCQIGTTARALDPKQRRIVTATILDPELAKNSQARHEFLLAAESVATISDPHVMAVFATHESESVVCQFQEYCVGQTLPEHFPSGSRPSPTEIARIGWQAASALAAAHQQGVVHGGLTPENLTLENGLARVKVTGFGWRRVLESVSRSTGQHSRFADFSAPEILQGQSPTPGTDQFSLGCILNSLCTRSVPGWLLATIRRMMSRDAKDRFPSIQAVAVALSEGLTMDVDSPQGLSSLEARIDLPVIVRADVSLRPQFKWVWVSIAATIVVVGLSLWYVMR